jgi:hypothetical protein
MRFVLVLAAVLMAAAGPTGAQTGELRLSTGLASGIGSSGLPATGLASASLAFVSSSFSLGPELLRIFGPTRVFGIGAVSRVRLGSGRITPFVVGGLGGDFWKEEPGIVQGLFTGSIGAGVELGAVSGLALEFRAHKRLQRYAGPGNWDFITVTVGGRLGW